MVINLSDGVQDWAPPLEDLDFSTNCSLVEDFYATWFRQLIHQDNRYNVYDMKWSPTNVSAYISPFLDSETTHAYFRNALPQKIRSQPSFGQVLDWEKELRLNWSQQLDARDAPNRECPPPQATYFFWDLGEFESQYFRTVVLNPGVACRKQACQAFEWSRLADINGPGVFIMYWAQGVLVSLAAMVAILELYRLPHTPNPIPGPNRYYLAFRKSLSLLIDTIAFFSLVTPMAMVVEFRRLGPHFFPPHDLSIGRCILAFAIVISVLTWRMNACFQLIDQVKGAPTRTVRLRHLPLSTLILSIPFYAYIDIIKTRSGVGGKTEYYDAFHLDLFTFTLCAEVNAFLSNGGAMVLVSTASYVTLAYCFIRLVFGQPTVRYIVDKVSLFRGSRLYPATLQRTLRDLNLETRVEEGYRLDLSREAYAAIAEGLARDPVALNETRIIGILELGVGVALALLIMVIYTVYRQRYLNAGGGIDAGWSLGQVISLSAILTIFLEFFTSLGTCKLLLVVKLGAPTWSH
ncbi:hypothetical protein ACJ41O_010932 [Fusarium nematophilum]